MFFSDISAANHAGHHFNVTPVFRGDFPRYQRVWRLCNTVNKSAMDKKCAQLWQQLSAALKPQISSDSFKRWFSVVEFVVAKDNSITLRVADCHRNDVRQPTSRKVLHTVGN